MPAEVIPWPLFHNPPVKSGDTVVSTVSNAEGVWSGLSPFKIGPCDLYRGHTALRMENAWQFSKVYSEFLNSKGDITPGYWEWAKNGWADSRAHRYPMGKGRKPEFSLWYGRRLTYVEARKVIYGPLYAEAVQKTKAWTLLQDVYVSRKRIFLLDYDAYDYRASGASLTDVLNNPDRKMGHAFVLAMLLKKDKALRQMELR